MAFYAMFYAFALMLGFAGSVALVIWTFPEIPRKLSYRYITNYIKARVIKH